MIHSGGSDNKSSSLSHGCQQGEKPVKKERESRGVEDGDRAGNRFGRRQIMSATESIYTFCILVKFR